MDGVFCVSDGPCRKRKFLLALAVGLPCVSFQFVLECVKQVRPLPTGVVSPLCCCWCGVTSVLLLVWCHLCVLSLQHNFAVQKCMVNFEGFLLPVGVSSTTGEHVAW